MKSRKRSFDYSTRTEPMKHQIEAIEYIRKKEKEPKPILIPEISKPIAVNELKPESVIEEKSIETKKVKEIEKKIDEEVIYSKRFETPSFESKKPKSKPSFSSNFYKFQLKYVKIYLPNIFEYSS